MTGLGVKGGRGSCPECMPRTCCPQPLAPATPGSRNHASRDTRPGARHAHGGGKGRPVPSEPARAEAGWLRSHGSSPTQRRYDICPCVGGEEAEALDGPIHCHLVGTLQRLRALTRHWIIKEMLGLAKTVWGRRGQGGRAGGGPPAQPPQLPSPPRRQELCPLCLDSAPSGCSPVPVRWSR